MLKEMILRKLHSLGQSHLALQIDSLSPKSLEQFWLQLKSWNFSVLEQQRAALLQGNSSLPFAPLKTYDTAGNEEDLKIGLRAIESGKVGCLILAGGQGSRLNSSLPKALIPILPVSGKSLLEIFCDKRKGKNLAMALMTSPLNHALIEEFLEKKKIKGVDLFQQQTLPLLDDVGNWMLKAPGQIAEGPDGNGHALKQFYESTIWNSWKNQGIEHIVMLPIDNPLAEPYDAELIGCHIRAQATATLKSVFRQDVQEKVGIVGMQNGRIMVREYSELPKDNSAFHIAHIGTYCFSLAFIEKAASTNLPLHLARKTASVLLGTSQGFFSSLVCVWKCERFIFDVLEVSKNTHVLVGPREKNYAPFKNERGVKSLQTVQAALLSLGYQ